MEWRTQWEYSHAIRVVFQLLGFSALVFSLIVLGSSENSHNC